MLSSFTAHLCSVALKDKNTVNVALDLGIWSDAELHIQYTKILQNPRSDTGIFSQSEDSLHFSKTMLTYHAW